MSTPNVGDTADTAREAGKSICGTIRDILLTDEEMSDVREITAGPDEDEGDGNG